MKLRISLVVPNFGTALYKIDTNNNQYYESIAWVRSLSRILPNMKTLCPLFPELRPFWWKYRKIRIIQDPWSGSLKKVMRKISGAFRSFWRINHQNRIKIVGGDTFRSEAENGRFKKKKKKNKAYKLQRKYNTLCIFMHRLIIGRK